MCIYVYVFVSVLLEIYLGNKLCPIFTHEKTVGPKVELSCL